MDHESGLAARLASGPQVASASYTLTADNSVRHILLTGGGWRLYGSGTQIYFAVRSCDSAGTLIDGESAPLLAAMASSVQGSPAAGLAWDTSNMSVLGALPLSTDANGWVEIAVPSGQHQLLYVAAPAGATTALLIGPLL